MIRPRLLDLFCGAGGAAMGYHRAGFEVVGVDIVPQPHYPFPLDGFDAIHASPPCQRWSSASSITGKRSEHPDLIDATRQSLVASGVPSIMENVPGSPLRDAFQLCGSSFGLDLRRHRLFEPANMPAPALVPPCAHHWQTPRFRSPNSSGRLTGRLSPTVGVYGEGHYAGDMALRRAAMGIDWMNNRSLTQAIPPAYTEFIGAALLAHLAVTA